MKFRLVFYFFLFSLIFSISANAAASKSEQIAELIKTYNAKGDFEGVVLAAQNGKTIHRQAIGSANRERSKFIFYETICELLIFRKI